MHNRTNCINELISFRKYESYLELGIYQMVTFNSINCAKKTSVDLDHDCDYKMSTDDFFEINENKFDIIFIDANHTEPFLTRDIINSLKCLNEGGVIICHDVNPPDEHSQKDENNLYQTAWKAFVKFRLTSTYLTYSFPDDCGLGIIDTKYPNEDIKFELPSNLQYSDLEKNRELYLGFKSELVL
jgi:hypothetical protein